ncbi:uncharacterized protein LOC129579194 isoform X2 [Sitodiplosis mosellana]|uniref:uncharacterized protein LOC129579194 isoform X2 n=1 Tax=Sitodiplosis mosellana TaxID=263140 RepID=UPI002443A0A4|nr:uncharacterized protein LOC129579194 isoform X2 [Sitodiplosis mosellana]
MFGLMRSAEYGDSTTEQYNHGEMVSTAFCVMLWVFVSFVVLIFLVGLGYATLVYALKLFEMLCCAPCRRKAQKDSPPPSYDSLSPVVVTTTTIPTVPQSAGYPAQSTIVQGYPMPQPQPGYPPQPAGMYPNQPMPQPYPMPPIQADYNPPSYDQVVRGGDAYQKQAPYNPNYSGQQ